MNWRFAYSLVLWIILPWVLVKLWWRSLREPTYHVRWGERIGCYTETLLPLKGQKTIWIHAVSMGEVNAAKLLVKRLLERFPDDRILFTQMTATGRNAAAKICNKRVHLAWLPYDYPFAVRRFLENFRPDLGVIVETEVWFNLIAASRAAGVPLLLANARLSEKSSRAYARISSLSREAFGAFDAIAAQTEADAARLSNLGARSPKVVGNLKYDSSATIESYQLGKQFREQYGSRGVFLAASTREGEEALLLDALVAMPFTDALLVIVPRHPDRFNQVAELIKGRGLTFFRRTEIEMVPADCRVVLGDSVGEMDAYYQAADVAFVGGSLVDYGGQNLIEACAAGIPVLIGPYTRNFEAVADGAINAGAAWRMLNANETLEKAALLLADSSVRSSMGRAGKAFRVSQQGATEKTVEMIANLLGAGSAV